MTRRGFRRPEYTQTPNRLFDLIPSMGEAELKIHLVIMRKTFGWQKDEEVLTLSYLMTLTGLSRPSVIKGIELGLSRGTIERRPCLDPRTGQDTFAYALVLYGDEPEVVKTLDQQGDPEVVKNIDHLEVKNVDHLPEGEVVKNFDPYIKETLLKETQERNPLPPTPRTLPESLPFVNGELRFKPKEGEGGERHIWKELQTLPEVKALWNRWVKQAQPKGTAVKDAQLTAFLDWGRSDLGALTRALELTFQNWPDLKMPFKFLQKQLEGVKLKAPTTEKGSAGAAAGGEVAIAAGQRWSHTSEDIVVEVVHVIRDASTAPRIVETHQGKQISVRELRDNYKLVS